MESKGSDLQEGEGGALALGLAAAASSVGLGVVAVAVNLGTGGLAAGIGASVAVATLPMLAKRLTKWVEERRGDRSTPKTEDLVKDEMRAATVHLARVLSGNISVVLGNLGHGSSRFIVIPSGSVLPLKATEVFQIASGDRASFGFGLEFDPDGAASSSIQLGTFHYLLPASSAESEVEISVSLPGESLDEIDVSANIGGQVLFQSEMPVIEEVGEIALSEPSESAAGEDRPLQ